MAVAGGDKRLHLIAVLAVIAEVVGKHQPRSSFEVLGFAVPFVVVRGPQARRFVTREN
jgi:hypothetical protein